MLIKYNKTEKGQALVILVLMFVAFIGLLALVLDGGAAYTARRRAQNAADAGALAGADTLCRNDGLSQFNAETMAQATAVAYAINRNGANVAVADADQTNRTISVDATVQNQTFFAGVIGVNQINAKASAHAACLPVCSASTVMPFAWACKPSVSGSQSPTCAMEFGTVDTPGPLYIIMDTQSVSKDFYCQDPPNSGLPVGSLDCDLDNDNMNDAMANGNRSWLDIDGGGANAMKDMITTGVSPKLSVETWVPGKTGVIDSVFSAVDFRVGDIVTVPVFDKYCEGSPNPTCATTDLNDPQIGNVTPSTLNFHIVALAGFKITCVAGDPKTSNCPGHNLMDTINPGLPNSLRTIEGYFIKGYVPDMSACETDNAFYTGVFTVQLRP